MKRSVVPTALPTALLCAALAAPAASAVAQEQSGAPAASPRSSGGASAGDAPRAAPGEDAGAEASAPGEDAGAEASPDDARAAPGTRSAPEEYGERRKGTDRDLQYRWKTAGRHYVVPRAFFSIHGYLEGVFGAASEDWTAPDPTQVGAPGQLLVPNTSDSSFQYDAALFISTDISAHTRSLLELHLVSDPGGTGAAGPGGLTLAMTEASVSWDLYRNYLTLGGGIYWAPFGIVNIDWLGGQALFTLIPRASAAFPAHFNERGVRVSGTAALGRGFGVNYVVSLGNGLNSFDITGQNAFDTDSGKTVVGRVGVFPGLGPDLEIGASFAAGTLRDSDTDLQAGDGTDIFDDPRRYPAAFQAFGGDLVWQLDDLKLRSYYIYSIESLGASEGVNAPDLLRQGFMAETSYQIWVDLPVGSIRAIAPKARFDWVSVDALDASGTGAANLQSAVYSLGLDVRSAGTVGAVLSLEYHIQDELKGFAAPLDNDRFVARLLARF